MWDGDLGWQLFGLVNAAVFTFFLHRRGRKRIWAGTLVALFLGPLVWPLWLLLTWSERRTVTGRTRH
jgi:hypothetical protein